MIVDSNANQEVGSFGCKKDDIRAMGGTKVGKRGGTGGSVGKADKSKSGGAGQQEEAGEKEPELAQQEAGGQAAAAAHSKAEHQYIHWPGNLK